MHPPIESKLPTVGTTIFTVMSRLAADYGAINLSQGFPDFEPPGRLLALANEHMHKSVGGRGVGNQYAPMTGLPVLREAIAAKVAEYYGANVDPDTDVTVTAGGTEALFCAIQALVRQGDAVVLLDPSYDSYEPAVTLAGGHTVRVPLRRPGFGIDWQQLRDALTTARPRLLILNFPHNPSGATLTAADLAQLSSLLRGTNTFVLSDEVYEHMLFDGRRHNSLLTHAELAGRSFVVSSFGKTYHATGWKVGYCIAPPALTMEFRKVHQFVQFVVATPLQAAIADFMTECPEHTRELPAFYQRKRDYFTSLLERTKFRFEPAHSTYFQLVDYSAVSDLPDTEFAHLLTTQHGVAAIPISVFSAGGGASVSTNNAGARSERIIRFCFAKHEATLDAAAERLRLL
jgi:methionine aminotransferase